MQKAFPAQPMVRVALAGLAAEMAILGLPASLAPAWFHAWFPFGRGWVVSTGSLNEHTVADFGYVAVGLSIVLAWAAILPAPELCRAVLVGALVVHVSHAAYHLSHRGELAGADTVVQNGLLILATVVNAGALVMVMRRRASSPPVQSPVDREPRTVEGNGPAQT